MTALEFGAAGAVVGDGGGDGVVGRSWTAPLDANPSPLHAPSRRWNLSRIPFVPSFFLSSRFSALKEWLLTEP
jgi:hypothetical protein